MVATTAPAAGFYSKQEEHTEFGGGIIPGWVYHTVFFPYFFSCQSSPYFSIGGNTL